MNKIEKERKIIREIIEYAYDKNEHDANYEEIERIREWISRIVDLEVQEMGYKTRVILGEINTEKLVRQGDKELFLRFPTGIEMNISKWVFFSAKIPKDFSTNREFEICFHENYFKYILKNQSKGPLAPLMVIMNNVFHELRHMKQYIMAQTGVSSYISLIYAKEEFITFKCKELYEKNHDSMRIEEDAQIESSKNWEEVFEQSGRMPRRYTSFHKIGITKRKIQRDDFAFNMFDKLMKKEDNRNILKVFPVLQKEYNEDGTKKSLNQLLENMKLEMEEILNENSLSNSEKAILMKDCKGMYFEILYREIKKNATILDINCLAENYDKDNNTLLFREMKLYFEERYKSEEKDIKETGFMMSSEEQEKEIELRERYYQSKIDFLDLLEKQQQNDNFLNGIINKGKKFVRIRKNKFII